MSEGRVVVLASGEGTNLQALLDAAAAGHLGGRIVHVVANRGEIGALARAGAAGVPTTVVAAHGGEARHDYDARLAAVVAAAQPDLVVLAGWMRLLTRTFLDRFCGRVINLHPALPGELPGTRAIERAWAQAMEGHRAESGVMVHLVPDEGVDDGPVLAVRRVPIDPAAGFDHFAATLHATERTLLVDTVTAVLAGARGRDDNLTHTDNDTNTDRIIDARP